MKLVIRILMLVALLCSPGLCGSGDFLGIGARIGANDGWAYDQSTYLSGLQPGLTAGLFADFWLRRYISLSMEVDYHSWNRGHTEVVGASTVRVDDRYDIVSWLPHINVIIPTLKWRPLFSIGPRGDQLVNIAERYGSGSWNNSDLSGVSADRLFAIGLSAGLGVISPRFNWFDFSLKVVYNPQFTEAGDAPPPPGSTLGGGLFVPKFHSIDLVVGLVVHPLKAGKKTI
jgi:hypothetical protein